jgi:hypothetical protein
MFSASYYHQSIRKYIIAFGNLFSDITIQRLNNAGVRIQTIGVPIAYGPKESFLVRINQDPNLDKDVMVQVPRIGFEIVGMNYDGRRKLSSTVKNKVISSTDNNVFKTQYVPVPYDIQVTLSIFVKNADDGAQILEQIVPYFRPEFTTSVKLVPEMSIIADTPVILNDVSIEDTYEGDFVTRRSLIWNLNFTIRAFLFGPITTGKVIKRAQVDFHSNNSIGSARDSRVIVTPGLLANGSPTSNSTASIALSAISANTDYGFSQDRFFYNDGLKYNPSTGSDS